MSTIWNSRNYLEWLAGLLEPVCPGSAADRWLGRAPQDITVVRQADGEVPRGGQGRVSRGNMVLQLILQLIVQLISGQVARCDLFQQKKRKNNPFIFFDQLEIGIFKRR